MIGLILRAKDHHHVAVYSVHEPPNPPADRIDRAEAFVFIREGFSWSAALFPPIWLAANRAWLGLALYAGAVVLIITGLFFLGVRGQGVTLALLALNIFVGFEAASFQRWVLDRTGWTELGIVSGKTQDQCERNFFDTWLANEPAIAPAATHHRDTADALAAEAAQSYRKESGSGTGLLARLRGLTT